MDGSAGTRGLLSGQAVGGRDGGEGGRPGPEARAATDLLTLATALPSLSLSFPTCGMRRADAGH